jgi:cobalt/nickel transport system permease protein
MHIPDGYLSPQTYIPLYAAFIALLGAAIHKVKKILSAKLIPFLGMAAAFSFLIMMFNIPAPGGTTGHAVGAALISLLFGPWVAMISISVALIIQAFVFGDGGITAIGANCFNMAIVMPMVAYVVFRIINQKSENEKRIWWSAFFAGYISLNVTAIITAVQFGIQPLIAQSANGAPLYAPFPLKYALPVMAMEHLLVFGIIEGVITAVLFRYFYNTNKEMVEIMK